MPLCGKAFVRTFALCSILGLSLTLPAQDGNSGGKCGFQNLVIPAPAGTTARPTDISDKGSIVGFLLTGAAQNNSHTIGFLVSSGKFTSFRFPGSSDTIPRDINKHGLIVGSFTTPNDIPGGIREHAFMVQAGVFHEIKIPGFPGADAIAFGVNDLGDVVGQFSRNETAFGFLLHKGKLTILSFPGATGGTIPLGINNLGEVVGIYTFAESDVTHGFLWKSGNFSNIKVPGSDSTTSWKISDEGDIVGTFTDAGGREHGFSFDKGRYTVIDHPNSLGTQIFALNNYDNVIGVFATGLGNIENVWFKGFCSRVF